MHDFLAKRVIFAGCLEMILSIYLVKVRLFVRNMIHDCAYPFMHLTYRM